MVQPVFRFAPSPNGRLHLGHALSALLNADFAEAQHGMRQHGIKIQGLALIVAYTLLGCTWLIMKTEGRLQERMHDLARPLALVLLAIIGVVSLWTPLAHAEIAARWFSLPNLFWFLPVPILVLVTFYALLRSVANNDHVKPFVLTLVLIFLGYSGLGISLWPNIIPPAVSIWEASAPPQSQGFMLVGALFIIPFILGYTAWSYYVFRGKVKHGDGYH